MRDSKILDSLNTSYVNLAAFIRYLREQNFTGSLHIVLDQYAADVHLIGSGEPRVFEIDSTSGQATQNEGAMERLLVHAREPGGTIAIREGEPTAPHADDEVTKIPALDDEDEVTATKPPVEAVNWDELLQVSGSLIAAVERAVQSIEADFSTSLRAVRIELGDDYPFLDPTAGGFEYGNGVVTLSEGPGATTYVTGLSECLRRLVNKLGIQKHGSRFRERVAVEIAVTARQREKGFAEFTPNLDRIAGTRVL
jgi:hypothetical protein